MQNIHHYIMASPYQSTDFYVRGTGHFILHSPEDGKYAHFAEIFWCINGCGTFYLDGEKYRLKPKHLFYYPPGSRHCFQPENQLFDYRWLSIDGPNAGMLFKSLGYKKGLLSAGNPFRQEVFQRQTNPSPQTSAPVQAEVCSFRISSCVYSLFT